MPPKPNSQAQPHHRDAASRLQQPAFPQNYQQTRADRTAEPSPSYTPPEPPASVHSYNSSDSANRFQERGYQGSAYGEAAGDDSEEDSSYPQTYSYERVNDERVNEKPHGRGSHERTNLQSDSDSESDQDSDSDLARSKRVRRSKTMNHPTRSGMPTVLGLVITVTVLLVSAGATAFFLTKQPDDERLYQQGQKELANGQYAFAVKTLTAVSALRPKDPKVFLGLARAYVGVDQVEKAWDCISQAQQLGSGVVAEPSLASDLANYYRQRGKYERAIELLRPLAKADIAGKKAELADLDALWGDESLRAGNLDQSLRCWEEVRDLREGSRYGEADARLSTIYQRLANTMASEKKDDQALAYLNKLNNIAQNARNYEMAAELYERQGQLDLAIDQMRKAISMSTKNQLMDKKLSKLLARRGKELLDQGNSDTGYAYLQQAKEVVSGGEPAFSGTVALRSLNVGFTNHGHMPEIS
ncbi:MAG TPA: hypothetical protein V6C72_05555, partial [Chroococcales cyanobacterium]